MRAQLMRGAKTLNKSVRTTMNEGILPDKGRELYKVSGPAVWSKSKQRAVDRDRESVDQQSYARESRRRASTTGGLFFLVLALPFGPVLAMLAAMLGMLLGYAVGWVYDERRLSSHSHIVHAEKVRLKKIVQNATFSFDAAKVPTEVFEEVVSSYKPMCVAADAGSVVAQKEIRRLHNFVVQDSMHLFVWDYVNKFMHRWNKYSPQEFCFIVLEIFDPLVIMGNICSPKPEVVNRIEEFLNLHQVIELKKLMAPYATENSQESDELIRALLQQDPKKRHDRHAFGSGSPKNRSDRHAFDPGSPKIKSIKSDRDEESSDSDMSSEKGQERNPLVSSASTIDFILDNKSLAEKHTTPISASEVMKLYKVEENTTYKWDRVCNKEGMICEKVVPEGSSSVLVRATADLPGLDPIIVFYHICNFDRRLKWDKNFNEMWLLEEGVVAEDDSVNDIIYSNVRCSPVSDRDFVQYRLCQVRDDVIHVSIRSTEDMRCPPKRGKVRAETYASGYIIRRTANGTKLFLVAQNDIKGLVPKFIVNSQAARVPPQWCNNLRNACINCTISLQEMEAWAAPFRKNASPNASPRLDSNSSKRRGRSVSRRESKDSNGPDAFVPAFSRYYTPDASEVDQMSEADWPQERQDVDDE
jgi:hypothetical protein